MKVCCCLRDSSIPAESPAACNLFTCLLGASRLLPRLRKAGALTVNGGWAERFQRKGLFVLVKHLLFCLAFIWQLSLEDSWSAATLNKQQSALIRCAILTLPQVSACVGRCAGAAARSSEYLREAGPGPPAQNATGLVLTRTVMVYTLPRITLEVLALLRCVLSTKGISSWRLYSLKSSALKKTPEVSYLLPQFRAIQPMPVGVSSIQAKLESRQRNIFQNQGGGWGVGAGLKGPPSETLAFWRRVAAFRICFHVWTIINKKHRTHLNIRWVPLIHTELKPRWNISDTE